MIRIFVFNDVSVRLSDGSVLHKLHTEALMLLMGASNQIIIQTIFTIQFVLAEDFNSVYY